MNELSYGAIARSLWSLRGAMPVADVEPTHPAVRYRAHAAPGIRPLADVYLPAQPTGASVVLVHGGGFTIGSRRMKPMRYLAAKLVAAGIAVCAVDYRMIFRGGRLTEALDDVADALAFWSERAPALGLDPRAISMAGLSAGGTLAMLAAARDSSKLHRLVCCFGLYEADHLLGPVASLMPRLLFGTTDRTAWRDRSPRTAPQPSVPTLLLHGTRDGLVPVDQARRLAAHRDSLGLARRLVVFPDAPHGFFNSPTPFAAKGVRELCDYVAI